MHSFIFRSIFVFASAIVLANDGFAHSTASTTLPSSRPSTSSKATDRLGLAGQYAENCGLTATAMVLTYYSIDYDIEQLATHLQVARNWERPSSMAEMKSALTLHGLQVDPFADATMDDVVAKLTERQDKQAVPYVAVLHYSGQSVPGHFYLLSRRQSDGGYVLADPSGKVGVFGRNEFTSDGPREFSGTFLLVKAPASSKAVGIRDSTTLLSETRTFIDMGTVQSVASTKYRIPVSVVNDFGKVISISSVTGSCGCLVGMGFNGGEPIKGESLITIEPGGTLAAEIVFDANLFGTGRVERDVMLIGKVGDRPYQKLIKVRADVQGLAQGKSPSELPSVFPGKLLISRSQTNPTNTLTILLPKGTVIKEIKSKENTVSIVSQTDVGESLDGRREIEIVLKAVDGSKNEKADELQVHLTGEIPLLEVKIDFVKEQ